MFVVLRVFRCFCFLCAFDFVVLAVLLLLVGHLDCLHGFWGGPGVAMESTR